MDSYQSQDNSDASEADSQESEGRFLKKLDRKKKEVDFDKMTRRQQMAYRALHATDS